MIFQATIQVDSPLALTVRRATGNDIDTLRYIPGGTIRGALAMSFLEGPGHKAEDPCFQAVFNGPNAVRFGDLRVSHAQPWPLSARICARFPDEHRAVDRLLLLAQRGEAVRECRACDSKMITAEGYVRWVRNAKGATHYSTMPVATRRTAHVQIDPQLLRAKHGQFFSSNAMEPGQALKGWISANGEAAEHFKTLVGGERELYLGRGRSRGQGRTRLQVDEIGPPDMNTAQARIEQFNREARRLYPEFQNQLLFSCTLRSHAILFDEWLLSRSWLEATDLGLKEFQLLSWFSSEAGVTGWHAAENLPRAEMHAMASGSCFLFGREATGNLEQDCRMLAKIAVELETNGIGERRAEGFGEVRCCDEFHFRQGGN